MHGYVKYITFMRQPSTLKVIIKKKKKKYSIYLHSHLAFFLLLDPLFKPYVTFLLFFIKKKMLFFIKKKMFQNESAGSDTERIFKNKVVTLYFIKAQCRNWYRLKPGFLG